MRPCWGQMNTAVSDVLLCFKALWCLLWLATERLDHFGKWCLDLAGRPGVDAAMSNKGFSGTSLRCIARSWLGRQAF